MEDSVFVPNLITLSPNLGIEELYDVAQGWDARFRQLGRQRVEVAGRLLHMPHMQYAHETYSGSYLLEGCFPKGCVVLSLVRSQEIVSFQNRQVEQNELLVLFSDDALDVLFHGKHQVFTLTVEEHYFNETFLRYFNRSAREMLKGERLFIEEERVTHYIRHMHSWLSYFHQRDLQKMHFREFLYIEMQILHDLFSVLRIDEEPLPGGRLVIPKAREMLHSSIENDMSIAQIAHDLGVSVRTLQHHFKHELGVSPKQYLQSLRLNAIYEELLYASEKEVMVSDIAYKYNYYHLGHFATEYKRMFGETPSQTLRRTA